MFYLFVVALVTLAGGFVLVLTQRIHGHWSLDTAFGVQNHHTAPTPRVGGVAVIVGALVGWCLADVSVRAILEPILWASLPAFVFGLAEDLSKNIGVLPRLLATMFSGIVFWSLTGIAMQHTGVPPVDWVLGFSPFAVVFTAFAVGGVANSVNIIDGFNGLASGAVIIMLAALGGLACQVGDFPFALTCATLIACILGFMALNWPFGKIFLGDGGAYLLGFLLACLAVLLPMRNPGVSGLATLVVCFYPVLEVMLSVLRRRRREGHHPGQPDKVHLHHLLHRRLVCQCVPGLSPALKNGLTSPLCWVFVAFPAIWVQFFYGHKGLLVVGLLIVWVGYSIIYYRLSQFRWGLVFFKSGFSFVLH